MSKKLNTPLWKKGWFFLSFTFGLAGAAIWFVYDAMMAPTWMRIFAEELAKRATLVSTVAPSTAFPTMKGRADPDSPYICFDSLTDFEWERVYFVPSGGPVPSAIAGLTWPAESVDSINRRLADDDRYQLIAFTRGSDVVELGYYFTLWGDISALSRPQGFDPQSAVFVADSNGETYTVTHAGDVAQGLCPQPN